ncbi:ER lumen protein retaining receptor [Phlyctema vagabunda]|uniref:ER lumen protein retaining receptor n=1 Tax=Phlyctema vagabunda TaxID=108571 RepID=A0ABR4PPW5_9HELO
MKMPYDMNAFRMLGDISHTLSKGILIWAIHWNRSAEGVSLITQALYAAVFITRYLDMFEYLKNKWNLTLKILYILSSLYILYLMLRVYARTREREKAWKLGGLCLAGSILSAPFIMLVSRIKLVWSFKEVHSISLRPMRHPEGQAQYRHLKTNDDQQVLYIFSLILESVCVLPQLLLLRQTSVPTVIDSYYLLCLGSYRAFYILNWIQRELDLDEREPDPVSVAFGILQTAFYVDFAWVYYSRQRVKLRNGGMVDRDDMRNGWLLRKIFHSKRIVGNVDDEPEDEESTPALGGGRGAAGGVVPDDHASSNARPAVPNKWGSRGISVSADDGVLSSERARQNRFADEGQVDGVIDTRGDLDGDAKMRDPDELAKILDDDDDEEDGILPVDEDEGAASSRVGNGAEWRDGNRK